MLYSTPDGQRKLRIMNMYLPQSDRVDQIFLHSDQDAVFQFLVKQQLSKIGTLTCAQMREALIGRCADLLRAYRNNAVSISIPTEIQFPESQRFLPLYILGITKNPAFKTLSAELKTDEKYAWMQRLLGSPIETLARLCYP